MSPESDQPYDPLPAMVAGLDQFLAAIPELARSVHGLYQGFIQAGFTETQALQLTSDWMTSMLHQPAE